MVGRGSLSQSLLTPLIPPYKLSRSGDRSYKKIRVNQLPSYPSILPILRRLRALRLHIERVKGLAASHEQPIFLDAAEAQIGANLREMNLAD